MVRKTLNQIHAEAYEKLPDAKTYPSNECVIHVNDGLGKIVSVIFMKYDSDVPYGWILKTTDY